MSNYQYEEYLMEQGAVALHELDIAVRKKLLEFVEEMDVDRVFVSELKDAVSVMEVLRKWSGQEIEVVEVNNPQIAESSSICKNKTPRVEASEA